MEVLLHKPKNSIDLLQLCPLDHRHAQIKKEIGSAGAIQRQPDCASVESSDSGNIVGDLISPAHDTTSLTPKPMPKHPKTPTTSLAQRKRYTYIICLTMGERGQNTAAKIF